MSLPQVTLKKHQEANKSNGTHSDVEKEKSFFHSLFFLTAWFCLLFAPHASLESFFHLPREPLMSSWAADFESFGWKLLEGVKYSSCKATHIPVIRITHLCKRDLLLPPQVTNPLPLNTLHRTPCLRP